MTTHETEVVRASIRKEHGIFRGVYRTPAKSSSSPELRVPSESSQNWSLGTTVRIAGMRHRQELNGLDCEIVHEQPDEHGRVYVRLKTSPVAKVMRVMKENLKHPGDEPKKRMGHGHGPGMPPLDGTETNLVQSVRRLHLPDQFDPDPIKAYRPSATTFPAMLGHSKDMPPGPGDPGGSKRGGAAGHGDKMLKAQLEWYKRAEYHQAPPAPRRIWNRKNMGGFFRTELQ